MSGEDSADSVHDIGARVFVGGNGRYWRAISKLQYKFLIGRGLRRSDVFVDVGCGCLRGGARLIRYLDSGHYLGIDKYIELIVYGVMNEVGHRRYRNKRPRFIISEHFEFEQFDIPPTFGIAQSLFTHLTPFDIVKCLTKLRLCVASNGCKLFATFHEESNAIDNPKLSNSWKYFGYTIDEMRKFGESSGWMFEYIGEWGHPRDQKIVEYYINPQE
jgi:hypothetical protein